MTLLRHTLRRFRPRALFRPTRKCSRCGRRLFGAYTKVAGKPRCYYHRNP